MNYGAKIYRTDENGEVNINVDRKGNIKKAMVFIP
jgi:hypothetical protein